MSVVLRWQNAGSFAMVTSERIRILRQLAAECSDRGIADSPAGIIPYVEPAQSFELDLPT